MRRLLIAIIGGYRLLISPWLGQNCRFFPSCSCYAQQALQHNGIIKGAWLAVRRIARCHPWHPGGYDPVPMRLTTQLDHSTNNSDATGNCSHG